MKRIFLAGAISLACAALGLVAACDDGDSEVVTPDSGPTGSLDGAVSTGDAGEGGALDGAVSPGDAGTDGAASGRPPWLLLSVNYKSGSELIAYSIGAKDVDGRLQYPGYIGTTYVDSQGRTFLLEQANDRVVELDPLAPWQERASWDVHLNDGSDAGSAYADPVTVVPTTPGKAYVLRFNRNQIAVIDDSLKADASAPIKTIDLSSFLDPSDTDLSVDPAGASFVNGTLYVLLANLDLNKVSPTGYFTICSDSHPKLIAIDPATDTVISAFDAGTGGIALPGYNTNANGLWYDAPRNRLLALQGGCNSELADAGKGPLSRREVDAIDLTTGAVSVALDLNAEGFPGSFAKASADEVILGFDFNSAKRWNVTTTTLGSSLGDGLSAITTDKNGTAYAVQTSYLDDGGSTSNVVEIPLDGGDGGVLSPLPSAQAGGFAGAVDFVTAP